MIITDKICKNYAGFEALKDVSFEINEGDIVGFLGKNGAGKTSLMRILTSFLPATSGKVFIDGQDLAKHSLTIRRKIGYLPETPPLYNNMTVQSYLKFAAEIKDVALKQRRKQLHKVLEECQLEQVKNKPIHTLSKGYKQRVGIAQAIIHEPKILILDEPTSGLDPIQIQQVRTLIKNQQDQRTVLVSTHTLSEIENIAERVLIIRAGKIIVDETLNTLLQRDDSANASPLSLEEVFLSLHPESVVSQQSVTVDSLQESTDA
ncbi:MAG: ABC-2 type transport system ATP-binding protein [Paraglaciecola sp.]|jgi:ABC-2 type transport system ATP-binding protein